MERLTPMKNLLLISFFFIFYSLAVTAQDDSNIADSLRTAGNYKLELSYRLQTYCNSPLNSVNVYNIACCYALHKNADSAFYYLDKAIDLGRNDGWPLADCDLYSLHTDSRWKGIENRLEDIYKQKSFAANMQLGWELSKMYCADQAPKYAADNVKAKYGYPSPQMDSVNRVITATDSLNMLRLEEIFNTYGWTNKHLVGLDGADNASIIILHAPLIFQKKYFEMIKMAVDSGDIKKSSLAYLTDKILTKEGKMQLYGTQIIYSLPNKIYEFKPIEDEQNVNVRRKDFGLGPIEEYAKHFDIEYKQ